MEIFKSIEGYEGSYEVSNFGNVKSLPKSDGNGNRERLLKQETNERNNTNYKRVSLSKNGKVKRFQVHRLVASAFIENLDNKPFINHIDNNGENNNSLNLEWVTHSENMIHAQKQGRLFKTQSKGGLKNGLISHPRAVEDNNSLVGKIFGSYKVLSTLQKEKYKRSLFLCECLRCNKEYQVEKTNLTRGHSKMCRSCGLKEAHKKRRNDEIK